MLGILSGIGAGINIVGGLSKMISGSRRERGMRNAIANYQRQNLNNVAEGLGVSRLGADLFSQESARAFSTEADAYRSGGTRGLALLGGAANRHALGNRKNAAGLDEQRKRLDIMVARDDARIRGMQERREEADLRGMGSELNAARQDKYSGMGDIGNSLMSLGALGGDEWAKNLDFSGGGGGANNIGTNFGSSTPNGMQQGGLTGINNRGYTG